MKKTLPIALVLVVLLVGGIGGYRTYQAGMALKQEGGRVSYLPRSRFMGNVKLVFDNGTTQGYAVELGGDPAHRLDVPAKGCVIVETQAGPLSFRVLEGETLVEERREELSAPKQGIRDRVYIYNRGAASTYLVERIGYSQTGQDPILGGMGLSPEQLRKANTTEFAGQVFVDAGEIDDLFRQAPSSVQSTIGMAYRKRLSRKR